jgi:hypothetical protein
MIAVKDSIELLDQCSILDSETNILKFPQNFAKEIYRKCASQF